MKNNLIIFLAILTKAFAYLTLTDDNNMDEFEVDQVVCIGRIRIDDEFIKCVYEVLETDLVYGEKLQTFLLMYIQNKFHLENGSANRRLIYELIHDKESYVKETININDVEQYLSR